MEQLRGETGLFVNYVFVDHGSDVVSYLLCNWMVGERYRHETRDHSRHAKILTPDKRRTSCEAVSPVRDNSRDLRGEYRTFWNSTLGRVEHGRA